MVAYFQPIGCTKQPINCTKCCYFFFAIGWHQTTFRPQDLTPIGADTVLLRNPLGSRCLLQNMEAAVIMARMMQPIYDGTRKHLVRKGKFMLVGHLWAYLPFKLWLGMLQPRRVSDIFDES